MRYFNLRSKYSFLYPLIITAGLTLLLFTATLLFLEIADSFGTGEKSQTQRVFQTIGDVTAICAYIGFSLMIPLGAISTILLLVRKLLTRRARTDQSRLGARK